MKPEVPKNALAAETDPLCLTCGHRRSAHYEYCLNGFPQTRCRECDPHTGKRIGVHHAMVEGSEEHRAYHFSDHNFVAMRPRCYAEKS